MTHNGLSVWLQKGMGLGTFLSRGKHISLFSLWMKFAFLSSESKTLKRIILRKSRNCDFLLSAERRIEFWTNRLWFFDIWTRQAYFWVVKRVEQRSLEIWMIEMIENQIISKYFIFKCLIGFLPIYRFLLIFVGFKKSVHDQMTLTRSYRSRGWRVKPVTW